MDSSFFTPKRKLTGKPEAKYYSNIQNFSEGTTNVAIIDKAQ